MESFFFKKAILYISTMQTRLTLVITYITADYANACRA